MGHPVHTDGIDFPPVMRSYLVNSRKVAMHHFLIALYFVVKVSQGRVHDVIEVEGL